MADVKQHVPTREEWLTKRFATLTEFYCDLGETMVEARRMATEYATLEHDGIVASTRMKEGWCDCGAARVWQGQERETYFHRTNHSHGWFCDPDKGGCGGIRQTG